MQTFTRHLIIIVISIGCFHGEAAALAAATPWSCSAYCLFRLIQNNTDSRLYGPVIADGDTAGQAFSKLDDACREQDNSPGLHLDYYAALVQSDGEQEHPATLLNSCLH